MRPFTESRAAFGPGTIVMLVASAIAIPTVTCGGGPTQALTPTSIPKVQVVTTTAILADFVRSLGGERVEVTSLVPTGGDVHSFQPTPGDGISIADARMIVTNGRGLDSFLDPLLGSAKRSNAVHVIATEGLEAMPIDSIPLPDDVQGHELALENPLADAQDTGRALVSEDADPHFWQNPLYAIYYVERIRDGLIQADPGGFQVYVANAAAYIDKLRHLDREIAETLNNVPPRRRHLVTFHGAFGHFARRYGWTESAIVPDDASDVTPRAVAQVMEQIVDRGIPMVFVEPQFSSDVLVQVAKRRRGYHRPHLFR